MERKDLIVIGGGPAGYVAAIRASQLGARVLLVEREELGGTCLHRGCVPTKGLLRAVEVLDTVRRGKRYGIEAGEAKVDFPRVRQYKDQVVRTVLLGIQGLMRDHSIEVVRGVGRLKSPNEIDVETDAGRSRFSANRVIIATGSSWALPPIPGIQGPGRVTVEELFSLDEIPRSLAIIGGGPSGVETSAIFAALGTEVLLIEILPHILPNEDEDIAGTVGRSLRRAGVEILTGTLVQGIEKDPEGNPMVILKDEGGEIRRMVQMVAVAAGRRPNCHGLGLEELGMRMDNGKILTNDRMETSLPGIYAAGDVVGKLMLAHVASREGEVAAENALGMGSRMDYAVVPRCVYARPEVGSVGMTEREALKKGLDVKIGRFPMAANSKALILGERDGLVKVVAEANSGQILGIQIAAPHATELVAEAAALLQMKGTLQDAASVIHAHPTLHEAVREAILSASGRPLHGPKKR